MKTLAAARLQPRLQAQFSISAASEPIFLVQSCPFRVKSGHLRRRRVEGFAETNALRALRDQRGQLGPTLHPLRAGIEVEDDPVGMGVCCIEATVRPAAPSESKTGQLRGGHSMRVAVYVVS